MRRLRSPELPPLLRRTVGKIITPQLGCYERLRARFADRRGLELGGPSGIFGSRGLFPVYPLAQSIDNCNFATETLWQGCIVASRGFVYWKGRAPGRQFIGEAGDLSFAATAKYDFVLGSHMLEHSANPLQALSEWRRVLKPSGLLVLVLPHRDATFDHRRALTSLGHLIEDFARGTAESDLSHLPEILELHDLAQDPEAGSLEQFAERSARNLHNRCLHHHVFDTRLAVEVVDWAGFAIHAVEPSHPCHIAIIAERPPEGVVIDNQRFLGPGAQYRRTSLFPSDREGPPPAAK